MLLLTYQPTKKRRRRGRKRRLVAVWRDKQGEKPATIKMRKPKPLSG